MSRILVLLLWILPAAALADDPHPGAPFTAPEIPPGDDVRVVLRAGERAQFEGVLFDGLTLTRWTNRVLWLEGRLQLEHEMHVAIEAAILAATERYELTLRQSFEREMGWLNAELDRTRTDLEAARQRAAALEERPWYRSFGFGMSLGAAVVIGGAVLGAVLTN